MVGWCLDLDGRQDRNECAKPIVGSARNLAYGNVALFSMVRLQETEMRKALQGKSAMKKLGRASNRINNE
jgi:hypothetical protein